MAYAYKPFPYVAPPGLKAPEPRHKVAIIGAGPVGLALAVDLATHGIASVVLDDNNVVSVGSRAICWSKRTLEIFDRLGIGERMLDKGVTWKVGRTFHGDREIFSFDLLPEDGHKYPAFINLQQYYVEHYLVERCRDFPDLIDLRFKNRVTGHTDHGTHVTLDVETPDGVYNIDAEWLAACDGAGSPTRRSMGLEFEGQSFDEHFLIVDVHLPDSPFPVRDVPERWFWFKPTFHAGQSALLHKQPDDIYRIDLQLGPETDPKAEATNEKVLPRLRAILGDAPFSIDWMSVYRFRCARIERFVHNRVLFVGDSAHVVSPFGARGGNGGIQDADNLGWKLAAVLNGDASDALLDSYNDERSRAADENITNSARTTNFMTPKSETEAVFRDAVLDLCETHDFARRTVNSGRLSTPHALTGLPLQTPGDTPVPPGVAAIDAPLPNSWLLDHVQGAFTLVGFGEITLPEVPGVRRLGIGSCTDDYPCHPDPTGTASIRYGTNHAYLFRPDGHVAASFTDPDPAAIAAAYARALAKPNSAS